MLKASVSFSGNSMGQYLDISKDDLKKIAVQWIEDADKRNNVISITLKVKNPSWGERERKRKRETYQAGQVGSAECQYREMAKKSIIGFFSDDKKVDQYADAVQIAKECNVKYAGDEVLASSAYDVEDTQEETGVPGAAEWHAE